MDKISIKEVSTPSFQGLVPILNGSDMTMSVATSKYLKPTGSSECSNRSETEMNSSDLITTTPIVDEAPNSQLCTSRNHNISSTAKDSQ